MQDTVGGYLTETTQLLNESEGIRPMGSAEVLDASIAVYRALSGPLLKVSFPVSIMLAVAWRFFESVIIPSLSTTQSPNSLSVQASEVGITVIVGLFILLPLVLIALSYLSTKCTGMVWDFIRAGRSKDFDDRLEALPKMVGLAWRLCLRASWPIVLTLVCTFIAAMANDSKMYGFSVVMGVAVVCMGFLSVVVGLKVLSAYALAPVMLLVEHTSGKQVWKRINDFVRAQRGASSAFEPISNLTIRCLVYFGLLSGGTYFLYSLTNVDQFFTPSRLIVPETFALHELVQMAPQVLAVWFVAPYWAVATTMIYAERRARLEGLDIKILNERLAKKISY